MVWYMTKILVYSLALVLGTLCASAQPAELGAAGTPVVDRKPVVSPAPATPPAADTASTTTSEAGGASLAFDDKHKLGVGDKLSFQIAEDREPQPKPLVVTDSGEIDVPYLGRVSAIGKTCKQLAAELKALLEKDYYYKATVTLGLDQASRTLGRVYVWGQVRTQGAVEIPSGERFTVGKAILRAGGFGDFANKKKVKLVRTAATGQKENVELNMVDILEQGKTEQDIVLQPDDFIIVPARAVNW